MFVQNTKLNLTKFQFRDFWNFQNIRVMPYQFLRFKMYKINGCLSLKGPFWQKRENELYFTCSKEFSSISFIFPCDDLCFTGFTHHKWFCHCKTMWEWFQITSIQSIQLFSNDSYCLSRWTGPNSYIFVRNGVSISHD